jgi:DNA-binding NarL/FixJ family response regulator
MQCIRAAATAHGAAGRPKDDTNDIAVAVRYPADEKTVPYPREEPVKRVLVCCEGRTDALCEALPDTSYEVVACPTSETMVEETLQRPPDLILCCQGTDPTVDSATLRLMRRLIPDAPLVVLAESTSLTALRLSQELRPVFFVLEPSDPAELREIVRSILASSTSAKRKPSDAITRGRALS